MDMKTTVFLTEDYFQNLAKLKQLLQMKKKFYIGIDNEDMLNKLNCLNGYLKLWVRGNKIPNELDAVIKECDEYLKDQQ